MLFRTPRLARTSVASPASAGAEAFDEAAYLDANPDVAAAVAAGRFRSGGQHFERFGHAEGRVLRRHPSRREKLLDGIDLARQRGLEIGPLMTPLVTKDESDILYVDHADTETLRHKYSIDPGVDPSRIVDVDRVWGVQTLQDCLGAGVQVDYVLNSHVIEHVPDLVTWLGEIHAVLKPAGTLRMAIPDRRYTFDILRHESTLADVLDAELRQARMPLPRAILDHFLHHAEVDCAAAWRGEVDLDSLARTYSSQFALDAAANSLGSGKYQDVHCWVFTPLSFAGLCAELAALGRLPFACERIHPTEPDAIEFIAALRSAPDATVCCASWEDAVRQLASSASTRA